MPNREILLRQVPLFRSLRPEDSARLAELLQRREYHRGEYICRTGEEGDTLYMIISGKVKIVRRSRGGEEVILAVLSAGDFCGEMSLLDGLPRSADVIAVEDSDLYLLTRNDFLSRVINNERTVKSILSTLSKRMRRADDFLADIFFLKVGARLTKKLIEISASNGYQQQTGGPIVLNVTQHLLASMIGATRESVNKELHKLRDRGLIRMSGKKIEILNLEGLKEMIR